MRARGRPAASSWLGPAQGVLRESLRRGDRKRAIRKAVIAIALLGGCGSDQSSQTTSPSGQGSNQNQPSGAVARYQVHEWGLATGALGDGRVRLSGLPAATTPGGHPRPDPLREVARVGEPHLHRRGRDTASTAVRPEDLVQLDDRRLEKDGPTGPAGGTNTSTGGAPTAATSQTDNPCQLAHRLQED